MTGPQLEQFYAGVRRQLVRMLGLLDENMPDLIMAAEVTQLWWRYMGKCPQLMAHAWYDDLISEALRRQARCGLYGQDILPSLTHIPSCERCDAMLEELGDEVDKSPPATDDPTEEDCP